MEERYKVFTGLITNISRCIQKIKNEEMEALGFKGKQVQCLFSLYTTQGGATSTELSELCGEDKGMLSRTIKELIEQGLVYIDEQKSQKYRNPIKLTEKGFEISEIIADKISKMLEEVSRGISQKSRDNLYSSLSHISKNLTKICENYGGKDD